MDRLPYLLLMLILVSCDNLKEIRKEKITFYFTENISVTRQETIANAVTAEIEQLKLEDLGIETVKVDSVPFSIVMYVPFKTEVTKDIEDDFKSLSNLLSRFDLGQTPVHIVLTDDRFSPTKNVAYDRGAVTYSGETMIRGRAKVKMSENSKGFSAEILEDVLRNRMPELYKGTDSVRISIDMVNDTINVDFNLDQKQHNIDSLRQQFLRTDALFFQLLFARRAVLFHVRDRQTKELITVFGVRAI